MAKIFGLVGPGHPDLPETLKEMGESFGFGRTATYSDDSAGLGHIRVDQINRARIAESAKAVVCFSGKLFGYETELESLKNRGYEFSSADREEEYVLGSYLDSGMKFLTTANGVFALAIYDKQAKKLILANDRHGAKPIFYCAWEDGLVFASEIKTILQNNRVKREVNWEFWRDYFSYGYALGNKTPIKDVFSLPNAGLLEYDGQDVKLTKYWDYTNIAVDHDKTEAEFVAHGVSVLRNVFQRQTKNLRRCTVMLSGGYDSRCIAASLKHFTNVEFDSLTSGSHPTGGDRDVRFSRLVADKLGIRNDRLHEVDDLYETYLKRFVWINDGMVAEHLWLMPILDDDKLQKVNFDGIGGDVFLRAGMFLRPSATKSNDLSNANNVALLADEELSQVIHKKMLKKMRGTSMSVASGVVKHFRPDLRQKLAPSETAVVRELQKIRPHDYKLKIFQAQNRMKNLIALAPNNIIMRKAYSYMPFFDNEFVEFGLSIPVGLKVQRNIYGRILDKAFPELKGVPSTNRYKGIKDAIKGVLVSQGMNRTLYFLGVFRGRLTSRKPRKEQMKQSDIAYLKKLANTLSYPEYVDKKQVLATVQQCLDHNTDPGGLLLPILEFVIWHEQFILHKGLCQESVSTQHSSVEEEGMDAALCGDALTRPSSASRGL